MGRHKIKHPIWTRIKFLFTGEIQTIVPRRYGLTQKRIEAVNKLTDKVEKQYEKTEPLDAIAYLVKHLTK